MSNCLKIPAVSIEIPLEVMIDDAPIMRDIDGNLIDGDRVGESCYIFEPATLTTWRELRTFITQHIAPYVQQEPPVYVDIPHVREESDGFRKEFTLKLRYSIDPTKVFV